MIRQEFDTGDLVRLVGPVYSKGETGVVLESRRFSSVPNDNDYQWHRDEYRCRIAFPHGETDWVRAKFLRIISRAKREEMAC